MSLFGKSKSAIGLDIGSSSIRAVEVSFSEGKKVLSRIAEIGLAPGIVSEGEVHDNEALSTALISAWRLGGFKNRKVYLGLANQKVIVRHIQLPFMNNEDLKGAINYEAQEYIPIPIEEAILDYQVLREFTDDDNQKMMEILVVAAQKNMIDSFVKALNAAKLSPIVIDVQSFALLRSVLAPKSNNFLETAEEETGAGVSEAICIIDMSAGITNLIVSSDDEPLFTRFIPLGGDYFTTSISDYMGISLEEAEHLKIELGLVPLDREETISELATMDNESVPVTSEPDLEVAEKEIEPEPSSETETEGQIGDELSAPAQPSSLEDSSSTETDQQGETEIAVAEEAEINPTDKSNEVTDRVETSTKKDEEIDDEQKIERAREILLKCTNNFIDELRRSLDYFLSQPNAKPIKKIILTGGAAKMKSIDNYISQAYHLPVEYGYPLQRIDINRTQLSDDELVEIEPRLAIAVGLALYDEER